MNWDLARLFAVLTWPASAALLFITCCRLNAMPKNTRLPVVIEYAIWAAIAVGIPLLPLIGEWPGPGTVALAYALVAVLLCSSRAWAGDVAPDEATNNAPLINLPEPPHER
jgi:hypothetical protein